MAKSTGHAVLICFICTVIALLCIVAGWYWHKPLIALLGLVPAVIYEVYRTEGVSTIWASWGMLAVLILEGLLIYTGFKLDLSAYLVKYISGLPAVDVKLAGPIIMAYFSYILIRRTAGVYTRWLAVVILAGCLGLFYVLDPSLFGRFADEGIREGVRQLQNR